MANPSDSTTPRIDKTDAAQVARWTRELDVTDEQLSQAIAEVGDKAADVELYLKGSRSSTNADTASDAAKTKTKAKAN
jgi:ABC-type transporter Mla subunit MlaD